MLVCCANNSQLLLIAATKFINGASPQIKQILKENIECLLDSFVCACLLTQSTDPSLDPGLLHLGFQEPA